MLRLVAPVSMAVPVPVPVAITWPVARPMAMSMSVSMSVSVPVAGTSRADHDGRWWGLVHDDGARRLRGLVHDDRLRRCGLMHNHLARGRCGLMHDDLPGRRGRCGLVDLHGDVGARCLYADLNVGVACRARGRGWHVGRCGLTEQHAGNQRDSEGSARQSANAHGESGSCR